MYETHRSSISSLAYSDRFLSYHSPIWLRNSDLLLIPLVISFHFLSYSSYSTAYVFVFHLLQLVQTPPKSNTIVTGNGWVHQVTKSSPSHLMVTLSFVPSKTLWIPYQRTITWVSLSRLLQDITGIYNPSFSANSCYFYLFCFMHTCKLAKGWNLTFHKYIFTERKWWFQLQNRT